jgi:hypothetical protein
MSEALSSVKPRTLVCTFKKLFPDLEEDPRKFSNDKVNNSEIFDLVNVVKWFENIGVKRTF